MKGKMKYLICLVIAILFTGCGGSKKSDIFLEYNRTGGLIGLEDHLTIGKNGYAVLKRKNSQTVFTLDSETLKHLEILLNGATFTKLKNNYLPMHQGGDLIEYTISYSDHTVHMMDTAIPEIVQPIVESLNQIVENISK
jgi:hypothetical protein